MNIFTLLNQERTRVRMEVGSKKRGLEILSETIARFIPGHSRGKIFEKLIARERLGSTGLGTGVAIPHCRLAGLDAPIGALITLKNAISFDSPDGEDVDILFCLLVPEGSHEEHLKILAKLAELLINPDLCQKLRDAESSAEALNIIHYWQQNAAA